MPEVVYIWAKERDSEQMIKTLNNIMEAYERDFAKHLSFDNLTLDGDLLNIPLFMLDYTTKIIDIALKKMNTP